jgi:Uma2 family endonuclease
VVMAIKTARWTRHDLERFPRDGNRYEVLDGELLVTPQAAFDHQGVSLRLAVALYGYCDAHRIGITVGPGAVIFGKNELQPDLEVVGGVTFPTRKTWEELPYPILAVEVLSPFSVSRRRDLDTKRIAYLKLGIPEYWVVDLDARCVHVWSNGHPEKIVTDLLTWRPDPAIAAFELPLDQLFGPPPSE